MQAPKVKLGDRITALQQIVSPFGKVTNFLQITKLINKWSFKIFSIKNFGGTLIPPLYLIYYFVGWFSDWYSISPIRGNSIHKVSSRTSAGDYRFWNINFLKSKKKKGTVYYNNYCRNLMPKKYLWHKPRGW